MDHFQRDPQRHQGELCAEEVPLSEVAGKVGTPCYVYCRATIERHVRVLKEGLGTLPHLICYAVKANANLALLELMRELGCGFDAVSVGELARVLKIGTDPATVMVSGVGKRSDEIQAAIQVGALTLCVESASELDTVAQIAQALGKTAPVALRVNPDVDAQTHPYIATGMAQNKFGVPWEEAQALIQHAAHTPSLKLTGITCHIGSQVTDVAPFEDAARRMADLARGVRDAGIQLEHLGMGGGLGIPYGVEQPPSPDYYGQALARILQPLGLPVLFEPGRVIVGNAGVLLTRVVRRKKGAQNDFVLVDAGMNDLIRPALYSAQHTLEPVSAAQEMDAPVTVVGPVCESADTFGRDVRLPKLVEGDLLAIRSAGAYGFVMSNSYNGRPRPPEVLCAGDTMTLIRERERLSDLWRGERLLDGSEVDAALPRLLS